MTNKCPTCGFSLKDAATRCPQCGRVFGEGNRCPHCYAVAAVRPSDDGFVCAACGKPRPLTPQTTLAPGLMSHMRQRLLRAFGMLAITLAIVSAAGSTMVLGTGVAGILTAIVVAAIGALVGGRMLSLASASDRVLAEHARAAKLDQAKRLLLAKSATSEELAQRLGTSEAEAEALATELAANDRTGIDAHVDEREGVLRYGRRDALPALRVEPPDEGDAEDDAAEQDASDEEAESEQASRELERRERR